MEYDPSVVTFEELMEVFWKSHDPTQVRECDAAPSTSSRAALVLHFCCLWGFLE